MNPRVVPTLMETWQVPLSYNQDLDGKWEKLVSLVPHGPQGTFLPYPEDNGPFFLLQSEPVLGFPELDVVLAQGPAAQSGVPLDLAIALKEP